MSQFSLGAPSVTIIQCQSCHKAVE